MGHDPDPGAEAAQLREAIRDAHTMLKDLRAAIREARQLGPELTAQFQDIVTREIMKLANHLQVSGNEYAAGLNASVEAARQDITRRLFDARIEYDQEADNFAVVFPGLKFADDIPPPFPEMM